MTRLPDRTPVVIAARRTPIGTVGHALARVDVAGLAAPVLLALAHDLDVDADHRCGSPPSRPLQVSEVVLGNCMGPGGNPARVASLAAGLGLTVPALTVDRQCGSGQEAVHLAANAIAAGAADLVLAGGVESASTAPWRIARTGEAEARRGTPYSRASFAPDDIGDPDMGPAAEQLAVRDGIGRARQDAYAVRSHELTLQARASGSFDAELVPVAGVARDERPRPLSREVLALLRPAFVEGGTVTAGNSCGVSDGAAVVAIVPERLRAELGVPGLALRGWVGVGVDPNLPGLGAAAAVRQLLERTGVALGAIQHLEMTEAFAAQVLACTDALGLDPLGRDSDRVCAQGGAIALGHPWGASGALLMVRLFAQLVTGGADRGSLGIACCAIGGGQGLALLAERVGP